MAGCFKGFFLDHFLWKIHQHCIRHIESHYIHITLYYSPQAYNHHIIWKIRVMLKPAHCKTKVITKFLYNQTEGQAYFSSGSSSIFTDYKPTSGGGMVEKIEFCLSNSVKGIKGIMYYLFVSKKARMLPCVRILFAFVLLLHRTNLIFKTNPSKGGRQGRTPP